MENEIWKDVVGFEGYYQVSNLGRIKSLFRMVRTNHAGSLQPVKEKIKKQTLAFTVNHGKKRKGYLQVCLSANGINTYCLVHRIVLIAFSKNIPENCEVCHIDGDSHNNRIDNLRWGTHKENMQDAVLSGTSKRMGSKKKCESHWKARFKNNDVLKIRELYHSGMSKSDIESLYGVKRGSLNHILANRQWINI